ncbi:hypothetical protein ACF1BS_03405 [Streptomyces sp. NPDC014748]|uniref:hypothetical protein n=1 Tax=Streptomyces sp. NPDC014748 TaxID=3364905 RepID=UPI003702741A
MHERIEPEPDPEEYWLCTGCGARGDDMAGMRAACYVTTGTDNVFLRGHCESCLPKPAGSWYATTPVTAEWRAYLDAAHERKKKLERWAEGRPVVVTTVHLLPCPVCGEPTPWELTDQRLVYAVSADRDEAVCLDCAATHPHSVLEEVRRSRAEGRLPVRV